MGVYLEHNGRGEAREGERTGRAADTDRQRQRLSPLPCLRLLCITRSFNGNTLGFPPGRQGETGRNRETSGPPRGNLDKTDGTRISDQVSLPNY